MTPPYLSSRSLPIIASSPFFTYTGCSTVTPATVSSTSTGPFVHSRLLPSAIVKLLNGALVSTTVSGRDVICAPVSTNPSTVFSPTVTSQCGLVSGISVVSTEATCFLQFCTSLLFALPLHRNEYWFDSLLAFTTELQKFWVGPSLAHFLHLVFASSARSASVWPGS